MPAEAQATFSLRGRNPDVLTCIANLSNDEVFTPPSFANRMLDTLAKAWAADNNGANIWSDRTVRFLDPCTKSGVFLREITNRLVVGLAADMPDLQERVDHILTKQIFGIGITHITSLLARIIHQGWRAWRNPLIGHRIRLRHLNSADFGAHARQA